MLKEIKFLLAISSFIFLIYIILNYYFSDSYKKKSFRSVNNFTNENFTNTKIPFIKNDTTDIIELINNYEDLTEPKTRKFEEIIK